MRKKIGLFIGIFFPFIGVHAESLKCDYSFSGAPMGSIKLTVDENGVPGEFAEVSLFFAPARKLSITNEAPARGEFLRLFLAKEDPNNELLMIVKSPEGNRLQSVLINNSAPAGMKELPGVCHKVIED